MDKKLRLLCPNCAEITINLLDKDKSLGKRFWREEAVRLNKELQEQRNKTLEEVEKIMRKHIKSELAFLVRNKLNQLADEIQELKKNAV